MVKYTSCDSKCKFNSTIYNSNQKWNDEVCQCEWKSYCTCKIDNRWNPSIFKNGKYLKSIVDDKKIVGDEIIYVMDILSTNVANTISTNMSANSEGKNFRYKSVSYIFHTILLVIILLMTITIICYHYVKHRSKLKKKHWHANKIKIQNNEFEWVILMNNE